MLSARGKFLLFADADGATYFPEVMKVEEKLRLIRKVVPPLPSPLYLSFHLHLSFSLFLHHRRLLSDISTSPTSLPLRYLYLCDISTSPTSLPLRHLYLSDISTSPTSLPLRHLYLSDISTSPTFLPLFLMRTHLISLNYFPE